MEKTRQEQYQETKKHGSILFPFNIYPCTIPRDFPSVPLHWHNSMELISIKKGTGLVQLDMHSFHAQKGDLFVIPPGTLHALKEIRGSSMEYENIIFDLDFLGSAAADVCAQEYLIPLAAGQLLSPMIIKKEPMPPFPEHTPYTLFPSEKTHAEITHCLCIAEDLCEKRARGYELGTKAAILRLIFLLLPLSPKPKKEKTAYTERLKQVVRLVEEEYASPLSIPYVAAACNCSPSHFMRWFKSMTGSSFTTYLNEQRLAHAASLLRQSEEKIIHIAQLCGFDNLSNFNRQFKARYGITPSQYKIE